MDSSKLALTLIVLAVAASGCVNNDTGSEGSKSVTVTALDVTPSNIYEGQTVRATIEAVNSGKLPATVWAGDKGRKVLKNYNRDCFSLSEENYAVSTARTTEKQDSYDLEAGDSIRMNWVLQSTDNAPLYDLNCQIEFDMPFEYQVRAYRQFQVKEDREISGTSSLSSESSSGPMVFAIETLPGATGEPNTYTENDDYVTVLLQLVNKRPEEEYRKGLIEVDKDSLQVSVSEPFNITERYVIQKEQEYQCNTEGEGKPTYRDYETGTTYYCQNVEKGTFEWTSFRNGQERVGEPYCDIPEGEIKMLEGKSATIRCKFPIEQVRDEIRLSEVSEVSARANYTYIKNAGSRTVKVKNRGN